MNNEFTLITEKSKIEKIHKAIMNWNLLTYGIETTELIHTNLYQDNLQEDRIVFEKSSMGRSVHRMVYVYEDECISAQKGSYAKHQFEEDSGWIQVAI